MSQTFCKHIAKAAQADPQGKALSKSLQSNVRQKEILKNAPPHDKRQ